MNLHIHSPIACRVAAHLRLVRSCIVLQKTWRGRKGRESVEWRKRSIVRVQCCVRVWRAKRQLKVLKVLYTCTCSHVHVSTCMYLHLSTCIYMYLSKHVHVSKYTCVSTCTRINMCMYMCLHLYLHLSTCMYIYLHVSTSAATIYRDIISHDTI